MLQNRASTSDNHHLSPVRQARGSAPAEEGHMARGLAGNDVHAAAGALADAGERPTVERIRAHLGTGSPNAVTRWLETWWQGLGQRLQANRARLEVPEA